MRALVLAMLIASACGTRASPPVPPASEPPTLVLHADRMLDVAAGTYVADVTIAIRGDRITHVGHRDEVAVGAATRVIELGTAVLMPGMIDAHVHLTLGGQGADAAGKTLRAGFTSVRDMGSVGGAGVALRDEIERGTIVGPRMVVAGAGLGSQMGACVGAFGVDGAVGTTMAETERIIDAQRLAGVDVIKICTGGAVLPRAADRDVVELGETTVKAIVKAARRRGLRVAAHAEGPKAIAAAIAGGVVSVEHGGLIDYATARAMQVSGTFLVPTLYRIDYTLAQLPPDGPAHAVLAEGRALAFAGMKEAVAVGVRIAMGTDAAVIPHGDNARELGALVEVGMSPAAAIRAATLDAAALLGGKLGAHIGSLAPGKLADVIAVRGDPLADVGALRDVVLVVKGGAVVHEAR